jgi:hypothetical protein
MFIDRLEPGMCTDEHGEPCPPEASRNLRYLDEVMRRFDLANGWSLLFDRGKQVFGLPRKSVVERLRRSALLLNVMGYLDDEEMLAAAGKRVFLDIDPGFGQMWQELGQAAPFENHHHYVTVGLNLGSSNCRVPTLGIDWIPTRPPVYLDEWEPETRHGGLFTTVASWRGIFDSIEYRGEKYGLRVHEFRKFIDLPRRTAAQFEIALDIDTADSGDLRQLEDNGWLVTDPVVAAGDPWRYRDYLRRSKAEFMVAKGMYVQTASGWFSDRSACYLACGRPVIAQDTGVTSLLPTGDGLLVFETPDEAAVCVESVVADYDRHAVAARQVAVDCFGSDVVLSRLLDRLGVG